MATGKRWWLVFAGRKIGVAHSAKKPKGIAKAFPSREAAVAFGRKSLLTFGAKRRRNPQRPLSVAEKHQLKVARDTLKMSDEMARVMGGPSKEEARQIIARLTGKQRRNPGKMLKWRSVGRTRGEESSASQVVNGGVYWVMHHGVGSPWLVVFVPQRDAPERSLGRFSSRVKGMKAAEHDAGLKDFPITLIGDKGHAAAQREAVRRLTRGSGATQHRSNPLFTTEMYKGIRVVIHGRVIGFFADHQSQPSAPFAIMVHVGHTNEMKMQIADGQALNKDIATAWEYMQTFFPHQKYRGEEIVDSNETALTLERGKENTSDFEAGPSGMRLRRRNPRRDGVTGVVPQRRLHRDNPLLTILGNPGGADAVQTFSNNVLKLSYRHRFEPESGDVVRTHEFEKGVSMTSLRDGRVVLWRRDGRPVWEDDGQGDDR